MSKRNKDDDIIISFLGTSREDVTGSSVLINYAKSKNERGNILLEMGLCQGNATPEKDIAYNRKMLENFPKDLISEIEYVIVAHNHIDHLGNLPHLNIQNGFTGKILGTKSVIEIGKKLIEDSVGIHLSNIKRIKESKGKKVFPLYTESQMYEMFDRMEYREVGIKYELNDKVSFRLINSGHVLGGCMIELWIKKLNNSVKHIIYSSDMGSDYNNDYQYFVNKREQINRCNLFISEATYNNPNRCFDKKQAIQERKELKKEIKDNLQSGKRILFSSFSFGRFQNLMCMLYDWFNEEEWFKEYPIILDGVLCHKINNEYLNVLEGEEKEYFKRVMEWGNFKFNKSYDGTISTLSERTVGIYISTSGFLTNGRIVTYLQQFLGNSKDVIYITGYCGSEGSLGWKILGDQKTVTIDKKVILKRAEVKQLKTFSSHIQHDELIKLYKGLDCQKILIHHSSENEKEEFGNKVREELRNIDKSTKVEIVTSKNNQFRL